MTLPNGDSSITRRKLSVLIVGAGVAGLTTAIEIRRRGCDVRIIEKRGGLDDFGRFTFRVGVLDMID
jgi:2-polyprenyl-6-methoxyphenol hydroxylase-like FAD-dependent oxidoreductase